MKKIHFYHQFTHTAVVRTNYLAVYLKSIRKKITIYLKIPQKLSNSLGEYRNLTINKRIV